MTNNPITTADALAALHHDCLRCGHGWTQTGVKRPVVCPRCHSPWWETPRREKRETTKA